jgi:predicted PurR-regulated permease PerM
LPSRKVSERRLRPAFAWLRWGTLAALVSGALVYATWGVLPVLLASIAVAYLLDRPMTWLQARGLSRDGAFSALVAFVCVVLTIAVTIVAPSIAHQVGELVVRIKPALVDLQQQAGPLAARIEAGTGIRVPLDADGLADIAPGYLKQLVDAPDARDAAKHWLGSVFGGGLELVGSLLHFALLPLFTYYFASEWPRLLSGADSMIPPRHRPLVHEIVGEIHQRIGGYVEGQLTLCAILGVMYSLGLWAVGIDLAFTVGLLSGALFVVPYFGGLLGVAAAMTLALLKFGVDWHVVGCLITFVVVHLIEGSFLTPRIVGERVGLHPLVVMISVVAGGGLMGIWGVLLAIPLTAALSVVAGALLRAYTRSQFYSG